MHLRALRRSRARSRLQLARIGSLSVARRLDHCRAKPGGDAGARAVRALNNAEADFLRRRCAQLPGRCVGVASNFFGLYDRPPQTPRPIGLVAHTLPSEIAAISDSRRQKKNGSPKSAGQISQSGTQRPTSKTNTRELRCHLQELRAGQGGDGSGRTAAR